MAPVCFDRVGSTKIYSNTCFSVNSLDSILLIRLYDHANYITRN